MINILFFVAGIAFGFYVKGRMMNSTSSPRAQDKLGSFIFKDKEEMDEMREDAREALTERTEKRKEKILYLLDNAAVHQEELKACGVDDIKKGITSHNVAKFLDVSSKTARKYLNELEAENKIKQIGKTGPDVYYVLN